MNNKSMIGNIEFETYQSYLQLQAKYRSIYKDLEQQYNSCGCADCKLEMILFGLELLSLNSFVEHMESKILPNVSSILRSMNIAYITTNGQTELIK